MQNDAIKVYIGYVNYKSYHHQVMAVSKEKKLIQVYLESHRGLHPGEYTIEKEYVDDIELLTKYDQYIISEFHGYYIPEVDQCLIGLYSNNIQDYLSQTIDNLKHIVITGSDVKKIKQKDLSILVNAAKVLTDFQKNRKILNKMNDNLVATNSILFCNLETYFRSLRTYEETKELDMQYKNAIEKW